MSAQNGFGMTGDYWPTFTVPELPPADEPVYDDDVRAWLERDGLDALRANGYVRIGRCQRDAGAYNAAVWFALKHGLRWEYNPASGMVEISV